ncbi:MAG: rRNA maturation RNase YbeY, partial [Lachnospiraceae bacterium]|nr:rRNA maturation RNase YbeY [Lachnospiraceae bacterium]
MTVSIEKEYEGTMIPHWEEIIKIVCEEACDYVNCPFETAVDILLVDNASIHEINLAQREVDRPTDVLSFPLNDYKIPGDFSDIEETGTFHPDTGELMLGDIVISMDKVYSQAEEYGHANERELAFLTAHSMLHLFGFDHMEEEERKEMEYKQKEI